MTTSTPAAATDAAPARARILDAAFSAFIERGYAETTTLEIATRAHVSKRALYAQVGNKLDILVACISARAHRLQVPPDLPVPGDRASLERALTTFGTQLLREVSDPVVIAMFRLAIAEAVRAPEVGRALDAIGRETSRAALAQLMGQALAAGLLRGNLADLVRHFDGLLWGNLLLSLLLGVDEPPTASELERRAQAATTAFLQLYLHPPAVT